MSLPLPIPRCAITIRAGTLDDVPFMDSLQRLHAKQVGWMPRRQLEEKVGRGHVLVAEEEGLGPSTSSGRPAAPVGYCIGADQYFKRDDCGIIYQMNVVPGRQRGLVGATLLKAMFDRAAYGCRLFCCWCAQDIEANRFWAAMGFVALAFRAGSRGRGRSHIFWQRRIREGDVTTPYWFPSQTSSGAIREDRIVLPIPPGVHWWEEMPLLLPSEEGAGVRIQDSGRMGKEEGGRRKENGKSRMENGEEGEVIGRSSLVTCQRQAAGGTHRSSLVARRLVSAGGLRFGDSGAATAIEKSERVKGEARPQRGGGKNDPGWVAAARELRDRWLERVNAGEFLLECAGKYEVGVGEGQFMAKGKSGWEGKSLEAA